MLKLLCGTYNFWFLSLMNVVFMTSLCMLWLDVRILVVPMSWWEYQNAVLTDANLRNMRQVVVVSVVNIFIVGFIFFAVTLQIMPDMREALVFDGARRSVAVHEVTAHSVVTLIILLLRLAYRYRATLKNKDAKDNIIQCISYVCKVKPRRVIESPSLADRVKALAKRNSSRHRAFLEFRVGSRRLAWRVVPMLMSRMVITSVWTLRLLWRVWRRHDADELIMIHGDVEYNYTSSVRLHHREQGRAAVSVLSGLSNASGLSWQADIEDAEHSPLHTTRLATRAVSPHRQAEPQRCAK
ncbi:hypothetical protein P43SY_010587 [Pythium insidiosum]|uniref:Transmembrane protein n=1 Tax=Pythium insidiosum TaxID=114742 RepID=A0AAD5Q1L6_PYTIN|nr:hypothetical protein P43SY_010587 [Pythium insidiosum]